MPHASLKILLALTALTSLNACSGIPSSWNPFAEPRQKSLSGERRAPAMNPGGMNQGNMSQQGGGQSYYQSAPAVNQQAAMMQAPMPSYQVYQPAPIMAAAPMPQIPVMAQSLPPAQPQAYGYAPQQPYLQQAQAPLAPLPQMAANLNGSQMAANPNISQMAANVNAPQPAQAYANIAPASGMAQPPALPNYAPSPPVVPQHASLPAENRVYPGPMTAPQPQMMAQAPQPTEQPDTWARMQAYAQPDSAQNRGYPQLAETPAVPPRRQSDEYQRLLQALEFERQQNALLQQAVNAQAATLSQASILQPQPLTPPAPQAVIAAPVVVPQAQPQQAPAPFLPTRKRGVETQPPQSQLESPLQPLPQATPAMPLPSGMVVFNPSDGSTITLTPPNGATAVAIPPSRYSHRRGGVDGDRAL